MEIRRLLAPIKRSIRLIVSKAIVRAIYDGDEEGLQKMQISILKDELRDRVDRFQNYGFSSFPHTGADAAVVFPGGSRDRGIILAVDDRRYRIKSLKAGEVAIYTDEKDHIILKRGNKIELKTKTFHINADDLCRISAANILLEGDTKMAKNVVIDGATTINKAVSVNGAAAFSSSVAMSGPIKVPDFIVDGVSLKDHTHSLIIDKNLTDSPVKVPR
jgi:phage baseplate assembly protein V